MQNPEVKDLLSDALKLVQILYTTGQINEDRRDALKELVYEEDKGLLTAVSSDRGGREKELEVISLADDYLAA